MSQNSTTTETVYHSKPIPISTQHIRHRSTSFSSESSNSPASSPPLPTPKNFPSPSSPIFYYLSQSPSKSPATFPFRGFPPPTVPEGKPAEDHIRRDYTRRGSTAGRFPPQPSVPEPHHERGVNLLRRLSLGNHLGKPPAADIPQPGSPQAPPNSAVLSPSSTDSIVPGRKTRRSATISAQTRPRRAPSPMGERMLKGHFDGFN